MQQGKTVRERVRQAAVPRPPLLLPAAAQWSPPHPPGACAHSLRATHLHGGCAGRLLVSQQRGVAQQALCCPPHCAARATATLGIGIREAVLIAEGSGMRVLAGDGSRAAGNWCNPVERRAEVATQCLAWLCRYPMSAKDSDCCPTCALGPDRPKMAHKKAGPSLQKARLLRSPPSLLLALNLPLHSLSSPTVLSVRSTLRGVSNSFTLPRFPRPPAPGGAAFPPQLVTHVPSGARAPGSCMAS